ncbi:MAG: MFS transporter [Acidimicrobiales bacterium]|nr:MFS transporter [Acidimicrobiales bacterium]
MTDEGDEVVPAITIAGIALASVLVPLNSTMIAVALPQIARAFDISKGGASVLITVYLVAMLVGQPLAGRVCDALGGRRLAIIAVSGFGAFSAAAMFAGSFWLLVLLRALQAAFAAALVPGVQAMLKEVVPGRERGRAFGVQGSVLGVGAGLGPVIGGLATAAFGWRSIFAVNLPVVVMVLYVLLRRVPPPGESPVHLLADPAAGSPGRLLNGVFGVAFSTQALSTFAQYALLLTVPIVLDSRGWSAASIGVGLSLLTLGMVVMGPYGGRLGDARGRRTPVVLGLAVSLVAVLGSAILGDDVPSGLLLITLLVFGLGLGVASPSVMTAGIEAAPDSRVGSASGLLSASRYVGSIASTLVLAGVVQDDGGGVAALLVVCAGLLGVSLAVARRLPGRPHSASPPEPPPPVESLTA